MGYSAIEPLTKTVADKSKSPRVRGVAVYVLYDLAVQGNLEHDDLQPAVDALAGSLSDPDENVRNYSAMTLAKLGDKRATDVLIGMIKQPNQNTIESSNAPSYLSSLHDPKSVDPLIEMLNDKSAWGALRCAQRSAGCAMPSPLNRCCRC